MRKLRKRRSQRSDERGLGRNQGNLLIHLSMTRRKKNQTWTDKTKFQSVIPNLKEVYGTFRHFVVISAVKSPYSFQRGIFHTFSSLIKPSTLPPSLHSWPVILSHGENGSNPKRTAAACLPPHLCTVRTLVWLL